MVTYCSSNDPVFPGYKPGHSDRQVTQLKGFHHHLHTHIHTGFKPDYNVDFIISRQSKALMKKYEVIVRVQE